MSTHPWDAWAMDHGLSTHAERQARDPDRYYCQTCDDHTWRVGAELAQHLETVHGIHLPMTPAQGGARFLDGRGWHAIDTELIYGDVHVWQRRQT